MLSLRFVRENPDIVKKDLEKRGDKDKLKWISDLLKKDEEYRKLLQDSQKLRHRRNEITAEINELKKKGKDIKAKLKEAKEIPENILKTEKKQKKIKDEIDFYLMRLPNVLHKSVPVGKDDGDNKLVRKFGKKKEFKFKPKSHIELAEKLDLVDFDRAAKIAGARFYFLKNELALLDFALMKYAIDFLSSKGFTLIEPPFMMNRGAYEGVTDLEDFETMMYKVDSEDLYLIATSEHPLTAMFKGEIINEKRLPIKFSGVSPCFRKEAGTHGKQDKGIWRVHQFNKIEQIILCKSEDSWKFHEELLKNAEELFSSLGLHCRIMNVCTGDIGTVAAKKYDVEAWIPSLGKYMEVVSCSNCTAYQTTRLAIRYMAKDGKTETLHTLNSTCVATTRALVALIENYQNEDGSIDIPKVLWPYMAGVKKIKR